MLPRDPCKIEVFGLSHGAAERERLTLSVKVWGIGSIFLPAAVVVFPFSYIFGDILTEVYGYQQARQVIWLGFLCNLIFVILCLAGTAAASGVLMDGTKCLCNHSRLHAQITGRLFSRLSGRGIQQFLCSRQNENIDQRKMALVPDYQFYNRWRRIGYWHLHRRRICGRGFLHAVDDSLALGSKSSY